MKKILLLAVLLGGLTTPAFAAAPKLTVQNTEYRFGQVMQGKKVDHTFTFKNTGDAPLHILKVRSTCGCTAALASAKTIPPGGTGEVKVSFDSTRFHGPVLKSIYMYSDAPKLGEVHFALRGLVVQPLAVAPPQVIFAKMLPDEVKEVSINVVNNSPDELQLQRPVTTSSPDLTASLEAGKLPAGKGTKLHIKVKAHVRKGSNRFSGYIFLRESHGKVPEVRIPVQAVLASKR